MAKTTQVECDHCYATLEILDHDSILDHGWLEVAEIDPVTDHVKWYDFCSRECNVNEFS